MSTHLVTGGSGFLGNLIAKKLLSEGRKVKVLDIWKDDNLDREIEFIQADIRDPDKVLTSMKGVDFVHHNAALVPLTKSGKLFWSVNVHGSQIAAECARKSNVKSFVHMSSSAVYGKPRELPINSSTPTKPIEIYGKAKLAGEIAVKNVLKDSDTKCIVVRPRTIIGPGRLGIFEILFRWINEDRNIYTIGKGDNLFQFVHAFDLMNAYMHILDREISGDFNVGARYFGTLHHDLNELVKYAKSDSRVIHLPKSTTIRTLMILDRLKLSPLAPWHYLTYSEPFHFDVSPLLNLGWRPNYSNIEMLTEAFDDYIRKKEDSRKYGSPHRDRLGERILSLLRKVS